MSEETTQGFVSWEEHNVCREKGKRVVHFFLKDSSGNSVLVVEGIEKSIRHMMYYVSDDFVDDYGYAYNIGVGTKWQSRREVVEWLTELISQQQEQSEPPAYGQRILNQAYISDYRSFRPLEMYPRKLKAQASDIVWQGHGWVCCKQLMHYPAFRRNGTTTMVHSFVFIAAEGSQYLGYIEDMYEDKKRQKKVRVRWFHRHEEVLGLVSQLNAHPREVFITPHVQVISAECIDGPAAVLTPKHYEHCMAVIPHSILSKLHVCSRQLKNNKIKPFTLNKLQGYGKQAVLSCIDHPLFSKPKIKNHRSDEGKKRNCTPVDSLKHDRKRKRRHDEVKDMDCDGNDEIGVKSKRNTIKLDSINSALEGRIVSAQPSYPKLKIKLSGRVLMSIKIVGSQPVLSTSFKVNDEIELLSQDSGIRGCWFRCKVLHISGNRLKVQYEDVQDAEDSGNLQEWVASCRVADPDKLGVRCAGRLTARPRPPADSLNCILDVGEPVDVWWCDGWWEGVVIMANAIGTDQLQIYLPGEDKYITIEKSNVRISRDWVNGSWVNAKRKPDILNSVSINASPRIYHHGMPPISEHEELDEGQNQPDEGQDGTSDNRPSETHFNYVYHDVGNTALNDRQMHQTLSSSLACGFLAPVKRMEVSLS